MNTIYKDCLQVLGFLIFCCMSVIIISLLGSYVADKAYCQKQSRYTDTSYSAQIIYDSFAYENCMMKLKGE